MIKYRIILILILILAFTLRTYRINNQGLFLHDEGAFLLVIKTPYQAINWLRENISSNKSIKFKELTDYLAHEGGIVSNDAKPGYFLVFLLLSFFTKLADFSGKLLSAIFGVLSVFFLYKLVSNLYSKRLGLLSAFLLSILSLHVFYSRLGIANEIASCLCILSLYFYEKSIKFSNLSRNLIFCGLALSYAFTCHYYVFYQLLLIIFYELFVYKRIILKRMVLFLVGFLCFPILFEVPSRLITVYLKALPFISTYNIPILSYSEQLILQFFKRLHYEPFYSFFLFPKLFFYFNGFVFSICLVAGLIILIVSMGKKENPILSNIIILSQFLVPIILWTTFKYQVGRNFVIVFPYTGVILAIFIEKLFFVKEISPNFPKKPLKKVILWVSLLIFLILGIKNSYYRAIDISSGYKQAIISNLRGASHISTQDPISQFYVGMDNSSYPKGRNIKELMIYAKNRGFNWLLTDYNKYSKRYKIVLELEKHLSPIAICDNNIGKHLGILHEVYPHATLRKIIHKQDLSKIKIYKLTPSLIN
jgi:hypothetical protein